MRMTAWNASEGLFSRSSNYGGVVVKRMVQYRLECRDGYSDPWTLSEGFMVNLNWSGLFLVGFDPTVRESSALVKRTCGGDWRGDYT